MWIPSIQILNSDYSKPFYGLQMYVIYMTSKYNVDWKLGLSISVYIIDHFHTMNIYGAIQMIHISNIFRL